MKKLNCIIFSLISFTCIQAQDVTKLWSLEECISYAIEHNINIQQGKVQQKNAEINLNTTKMSRLPDLGAGMGQNWSFGRNISENNTYENQTMSNSSFGISSSTPLFTGFKINNQIDKSEFDLNAATQGLEKAKEDLSLNIASLFLTALFNKELLKVSEEQLVLSQSQVTRTEYLVEVGKVPSSQLFDMKAQVAKDEVSVVEADNKLKLSLLDLMQSLELERSESFDIQIPDTETVLEDLLASVLPPDLIYDNAVTFKPMIKEQEFLLESTKKDLKIAQAGYWPTLDLNLSYSNRYYHSYSAPNPSFKDQFKNNAGEIIGLSLNIPIFSRFRVKNQVRSARLGIQNQQLELENTKKKLYKEIQTAYLNAVASQKKFISSTNAVEASQESFKYSQERYEIGKSSVFEFSESRTKLIQSLSQQIQAKYDYIFSTKILDFYNGVPIRL